MLAPGVLGLRSRVLESWVLEFQVLSPGVPGPVFSIYTMITLQRNLFTEVTGNRVSNIVQETSV